jgi:hypothetical protein
MTRPGVLYWLVAAIAALSVVSGAVLILWPGGILGILGSEQSPTTLHFFGLVGMFMALFGGALLHALFSGRNAPIVVLWCGLQKDWWRRRHGDRLGAWHLRPAGPAPGRFRLRLCTADFCLSVPHGLAMMHTRNATAFAVVSLYGRSVLQILVGGRACTPCYVALRDTALMPATGPRRWRQP